MPRMDYRDVIGGALLLLLGASVALYSGTHYNHGTLAQMGPGTVPSALGALLAVLGGIILVPALFRSGDLPVVNPRAFAGVFASLGSFALSIERIGLVGAVALMIAILSLGDPRLTIKRAIVIAAVLSTICTLVFVYGLGIPLPLAVSPF
jgi:hypothetical protein